MKNAAERREILMKPEFSKTPEYTMLREGRITEFNASFEDANTVDLQNLDFRDLDLRGLEITKMDLRGCYFRQTDLRGLDLSECNLEGASIHSAKISGVLFPKELSASEILLSLQFGTRLRYGT